MLWSGFTNFHIFLVQELEFPQPTSHALAWLWKYSSKADFCLIWNTMLFKPKYQYQYDLIPNGFRHYVRNELSCRITNLQTGKEAPRASKEQVLEKFLLAFGCELEIHSASSSPPPAALTVPCIHRSRPGLQCFSQIQQNSNLAK